MAGGAASGGEGRMSVPLPYEARSAGSGATRASWLYHPGVLLVLRLVLAAVFIYAAVQKIGKPLLFADEIHAYGVVEYGPPIYIMAIVLPWLELLCGLSLLSGFALRGSALMLLALNALFFAVIAFRSASIVQAGTSFLDVYFDCGCGFGPTYAWKKLIENAASVAAAGIILVAPAHRFVFPLGRRSL
jgi:putative oxidoreductase